MTKLYKSLFFIILFFISKILSSQSLIGTQSNYAGSNSLSMNPASMTTSDVYFDFSIINVGMSLYNNYAYLKANDFSSFIFSNEHAFPTYNIDGENFNFLTYNNNDKRPYDIYESLDANVMRFMYNIDGRQSVAFSLNARAYTSGVDIPYEIPEIITKGLDDDNFNGNYVSSDASVSTMEWAEVALAYSRKLYDRYHHRIDFGLSAKYLLGYSAAVGNINNLDYDIFYEDTIVVNKFDADIAYSLPINYNADFSSSSMFDNSIVRGAGLAFDLGFVYTYKRNIASNERRILASCMQSKLDYVWKLGVSLMDVGYIHFKNNAAVNSFRNDDKVQFNTYAFDDVKQFKDVMEFMSTVYYNGDSLASLAANEFSVGLPTTLRLQFDYNIKDNFYINATYIQPLKLMKYSVETLPQLMIEPRYESEYLEFSIPVTLQDYRHLLLGASARLGFITIGTQNISSYLGFGDVRGVDVFVSMKFNLTKGKCNDRFSACWSSNFGNKKYRR